MGLTALMKVGLRVSMIIKKKGFDREDPLVKSIVYKDNVDAGKASVTMRLSERI